MPACLNSASELWHRSHRLCMLLDIYKYDIVYFAELVDLGAIPTLTRQSNPRLKQQTVSGTIAQVTQ